MSKSKGCKYLTIGMQGNEVCSNEEWPQNRCLFPQAELCEYFEENDDMNNETTYDCLYKTTEGLCTNTESQHTHCVFRHTNHCKYVNHEGEGIKGSPRLTETPKPPALGDSLMEAHKTITGDRQDSYGAPENSFQLIANYWSTYLGHLEETLINDMNLDPTTYLGLPPLKAKDVAHMMLLLKTDRCSGQASCRDNYIDIQGYAAIAADVLLNQE